jgi:predicted protein tyrosine phosphatase
MNEFQELINRDAEHRNQVLASGYTGCDVVVMGQGQAKAYVPETDSEVCISISTGRWGDVEPVLSDKFKNILRISFDDIAIGDADFEEAQSIDDKQARAVIMFFYAYYQTSSRIVIHCFAGMSRSRSMAGTLCKCFGLPFEYTILNKHVESQITKAYRALLG